MSSMSWALRVSLLLATLTLACRREPTPATSTTPSSSAGLPDPENLGRREGGLADGAVGEEAGGPRTYVVAKDVRARLTLHGPQGELAFETAVVGGDFTWSADGQGTGRYSVDLTTLRTRALDAGTPRGAPTLRTLLPWLGVEGGNDPALRERSRFLALLLPPFRSGPEPQDGEVTVVLRGRSARYPLRFLVEMSRDARTLGIRTVEPVVLQWAQHGLTKADALRGFDEGRLEIEGTAGLRPAN